MTENDIQKTIQEETMVRNLIKSKIVALGSYDDNNSEILAYRLAEIIVSAKKLYTENFPELMNIETDDEKKVWDVVMAMRMNLLHLRDCVEDFDMMLLELMDSGREPNDE